TSIEARERILIRVRDTLANDFPNVRSKADRLFNGPPVGWAVQVRVTGPDRGEVRRLAGEVADAMRTTPEVSNVHDDWLGPCARWLHSRWSSSPASNGGETGCPP